MHQLGDNAQHKLMLTGTLFTGKEIDVFSQYRFLDADIFGKWFFDFRARYFDMGGYGNHTPIFRECMREDFLAKLHSIAYRVTKSECLDLPEITEDLRLVDLEGKASRVYIDLEKEWYSDFGKFEITAQREIPLSDDSLSRS